MNVNNSLLENERLYFQEIYNEIMKLNSKIRFVTIIDFNGRLMFGGQREGISNYLSPQSEKESLRHAIEAWKTRDKLSSSIGKGKYAFAEYEKIKRITLPFDRNHLVFLTTEVDVDHNALISYILELIKRHRTQNILA